MPKKKMKIPVKCLWHQMIPTDNAANPVSATNTQQDRNPHKLEEKTLYFAYNKLLCNR